MKQKSFLRRLMASYLVIAVLPLTIILMIYLAGTIDLAGRTARQRLEAATELVSSQFNSLITNMSFLSINLLSNDNFITAVECLEKEESPRLQQEYYSQISSEICTYAIFSSLHDVTFFNDKGYLITSHDYNRDYNYKYRMSQEEMNEISWYQDVQGNFGQEIIMPIQKNQIPKSDTDTITLVRAIRNPGKIVGYLCIEIETEQLTYILDLDDTLDAEMLIVRSDSTVLYGSEEFPAEIEQGILDSESMEEVESGYFLVSCEDESTGITVYMAMDKQVAYAETIHSMEILGIEAIGLFGLTILIILFFTKDLSKPLLALREEMKETTISNLTDRGNDTLFDRYEEIAYVYHQFHEMRERLDVMIQKEMENQKMYLEERMSYLQAQINPHFMCNTLNVIAIMGAENGVQKIYDACLQLSSLLQYSIADKADGNSTIQDEMENIRDYLELMKLRYEHRLEYSVFYDENIREICMPRLVLEPFVENIFVHAYSSAHNIVRVNVTGYIQKGVWYIVIEDDGQGMREKQLQELKRHIDSRCEQLLHGKRTNQKYGIGIENTIMRLCLCYNGSFRYSLESKEDRGFRIVLSAEMEEDDENGTNEGNHS